MKPLGPEGEEIAVRFLKDKGFRILYRNYKTPLGEADIIARDKGTTVFVEVKTRSSARFGEPFEAVDARKQDKLRKIALFYQKNVNHGDGESPVRFDVISIKIGEDANIIEHITEAF